MLDSIFQQSLKWEQEKGLSNDPVDKGGLTNDGITWAHYNLLCLKVLKIKPTKEHFTQLREKEIKAFYQYSWNLLGIDDIQNTAVAAVCFDFALNSQFAKREIQKVLIEFDYKLYADNAFGPITIVALNNATAKYGAKRVVAAIMDAREAYLRSLVKRDKTQKKFLKGWLNRVNDWRVFAEKMIDSPQPPDGAL